MAADQPTILATSSGLLPDGDRTYSVKPSKLFTLAAELAHVGSSPRLCLINTAGGEDPAWASMEHNAFSKIGFVS
ncbi:MAG TPA: hypothetical protein VGF87_00670, partial [Acidimicrobiales bacterium]